MEFKKLDIMKKSITVLIALLCTMTIYSQKSIERQTIEVDGVCGMCQARIEKVSFKNKGVKSASWSIDTHELTLIFDASKISLDSIQSSIAKAGHNTPLFKATEEAYESLPMCCKYRTVEPH